MTKPYLASLLSSKRHRQIIDPVSLHETFSSPQPLEKQALPSHGERPVSPFKHSPLVMVIGLALISATSYAATPKQLPSRPPSSPLAGTYYKSTQNQTLDGEYVFSAPEVEIESDFVLGTGSSISTSGKLILSPFAENRMSASTDGEGVTTSITASNLEVRTQREQGTTDWGSGFAARNGAVLTVEVSDTFSGNTNGRKITSFGGGHLIIHSGIVDLKDSSIVSGELKSSITKSGVTAQGRSITDISAKGDIRIEGGIQSLKTGTVNIGVGGNIHVGNGVYSLGQTTIKAAEEASDNSVWTFNTIIASNSDNTKPGLTIATPKSKEIRVNHGIYIATGVLRNNPSMAFIVESPKAHWAIDGQAYYSPDTGPFKQYDYGFVTQSGSISKLNTRSITINNGLHAFNGYGAAVHITASEDIVLTKTTAEAPTLKVIDPGTQVTLTGKNIYLTGREGFNTVEVNNLAVSSLTAQNQLSITGDTFVNSNASLTIKAPSTELKEGALSVNNASVKVEGVDSQTPSLSITNLRGAEGKTASAQDPLEALFIDNSQLDWSGVDTKLSVTKDATYSSDMGTALRITNKGALSHDKARWNVIGNVLVDSASSALTIGKDSKVTEVGDVFATNGGKVDMTLGAGSAWEGRSDDFLDVATGTDRMKALADLSGKTLPTSGQIKLTMAGGTWTARGQSTLSELAFTDKGTVDMTKEVASSVHIGKLTGSDGTFKMTLHSDPTKSDMLYVDDASGASNVNVQAAIVDGDDVTKMEGLRFATTKGNTADSLFKVSSEDQGFNDMKFNVAHEVYNQDKSAVNKQYNEGDAKPGNDLVNQVYGDKGTNWYLTTADLTPSTSGKVILATARHNYWQAVDMDRLNKRLGDRRLAGDEDHGLWVRMRHDRLGTNAGMGDFRSRDWNYQVGYDYSWKRDGGQQLFGFALDYKDADTHYRSVTGTGSSDRVGLTAYTTWLGETGWYYDAVARVGRLSNDFTLFNSRGERITGDYHNTVWSLSLEGGKKLTHEATRIYFEPQAQVQFLTVSDADYTTSQETRVHQDRLNSVITRLGFRLGRDFGAQERSTVYVKADWMREWRGRETIRAYDVTTPDNGSEVTFKNRGNWFDVGLGVQSPITDKLYGFVDTEYRFGNDLQKSWQFNAGVRLLF